jgi:hypothetical protein
LCGVCVYWVVVGKDEKAADVREDTDAEDTGAEDTDAEDADAVEDAREPEPVLPR